MYKIFHRYGFTVYESPEIESEHYNFNALNSQEDHPARDMQDTFFVKNGEQMVLEHIECADSCYAAREATFTFDFSWSVYRVDSQSHSPMFHQIECVVVDKKISTSSHLKMKLSCMTSLEVKPKFVSVQASSLIEPGVEIDIYGPKGWLRNWWSRNDSPQPTTQSTMTVTSTVVMLLVSVLIVWLYFSTTSVI